MKGANNEAFSSKTSFIGYIECNKSDTAVFSSICKLVSNHV